MSSSARDIREALRLLKQTPQHFKRTASGLTEAQLRQRPDEKEWSVNEVLAHLRGAADVQGRWIAKMLSEETPTIRYVSPRTGMRKGNYVAYAFEASLREFTRQRLALVKTLSALKNQGWTRSASFTGTSPGWTQTVLDVATGIVRHEESHFEQIAEAAEAAL